MIAKATNEGLHTAHALTNMSDYLTVQGADITLRKKPILLKGAYLRRFR
jgi:hypothetical protein